MKDLITELESKVKNCHNTNTIFDTRNYVLLDDVRKLIAAINYTRCCVSKDLDKHPIEGVNETMQVDTELEEIQLCGKSNCNRQKLEGNVYCSYHYDINFG